MSAGTRTEAGELAASLAARIRELAEKIGKNFPHREIVIMEVCGTHTVALRKHGIHSLLPSNIRLVSGPGCPVCVTPSSYIGNAIDLLQKNETVMIATFGDMAKVPDESGRTLAGYSGTGKVAVIYSPADLLGLCGKTGKEIVFLGIGFETTIPTIASMLKAARKEGIRNLSVYCCFKLVPPALEALLSDPSCAVDALLLPGHVSAILGLAPYTFIQDRYRIPAVIAGFEGLDLLTAIYMLLRQLDGGRGEVENAYPRVVKPEGNVKAAAVMKEVFVPADSLWRGLGVMPASGLALNPSFIDFDAQKRFGLPQLSDSEPAGCGCSSVIQGKLKPTDCPLFGSRCTPDRPVGPCMVSSEGACAAWYFYGAAAV